MDAGDYLAAGDALAEQGRWSEAQAAFEMATKLAPKASLTWLSYALACFPQHRFGPAGTAIEDALHYAIPILDTLETRKGLEAYRGEKWAEAQRWFERALAKGAPDSAPHLLLAMSMLRQGKSSAALSHLVTAKAMEEAGAKEAGAEESQP
ncbi:MAG TPA: tetratricopeptide repeat protein [Candidatus Eisenbacteria bacterium]|nr:tetratricopeptide repeat protein [Candidatus Eisenbacteria bacterium]